MKPSSQMRALADDFVKRVKDRAITVGVVGLGYVGLPLIMAFNEAGFNTLGFDIDTEKAEGLKKGRNYIAHFPDSSVKKMAESGRFDATTDFSRAGEADALLLCVPTPLNKYREPDLSYVVETAKSLAPHLRKGQIIVLESTTWPGTTKEVLQPILEEGSGLKAHEDFVVAYSPEREDPGNPKFKTTNITKVVGAATPEALDMAVALYDSIISQVVPVSSPETAEAVKLTENIFRAVNIALVNELKMIYDDMGIDVWEVIDAAATKPFGFMAFYPGPGLGGHCIPIDPFYLTWKAREYDHHTRFIELAGEINHNMPKYVVNRLAHALNRHQGKALSRSRILLVGIAYKKNVDDMRESPSLVLMELLEKEGARVDYHDPYIPVIPSTREHAHFAGRESVDLSPETIAAYDCVLVATDHDNIDWPMLAKHANLIVDTRNALKDFREQYADKIVKA